MTESVWDYPRPPRVEPSDEHVVVTHRGVVLADTTASLRVLETSHPPTYYLPRSRLRRRRAPAGPAGRVVVRVEGRGRLLRRRRRRRGAARRSRGPTRRRRRASRHLLDHVALYPGRVDRCTVDGEVVEPQPGQLLRRLDHLARHRTLQGIAGHVRLVTSEPGSVQAAVVGLTGSSGASRAGPARRPGGGRRPGSHPRARRRGTARARGGPPRCRGRERRRRAVPPGTTIASPSVPQAGLRSARAPRPRTPSAGGSAGSGRGRSRGPRRPGRPRAPRSPSSGLCLRRDGMVRASFVGTGRPRPSSRPPRDRGTPWGPDPMCSDGSAGEEGQPLADDLAAQHDAALAVVADAEPVELPAAVLGALDEHPGDDVAREVRRQDERLELPLDTASGWAALRSWPRGLPSGLVGGHVVEGVDDLGGQGQLLDRRARRRAGRRCGRPRSGR